jgi:hypothetical protein
MQVVEEIEILTGRCQPYGEWPLFHLVDDDFGPLERLEELVGEMKARRLKVAFSVELRAPVLTNPPFEAERWRKWREAGLCRIFVGLESFRSETLRRWHKSVSPELLAGVIKELRTLSIEVETGYILWHRDSTQQQVFEEIDQLYEYELLTPKAALSRLIVYPGSDLYSRRGFTGEAVPEPLPPPMEGLFREMEERLAPLLTLWTKGALLLPQAAALAYLTGREAPYRQLKSLLHTVNEQTYRRIHNPPNDISPFFHAVSDELDQVTTGLGLVIR